MPMPPLPVSLSLLQHGDVMCQRLSRKPLCMQGMGAAKVALLLCPSISSSDY